MTISAALTPKELAQLLLAYEADLGKTAAAKDSAAGRVFEKLRGPLGRLVGIGGYRSLLSRALALALAEVPWLLALEIKADGILVGLAEQEAKLDSHTVVEGEATLLSQLLGLLATFIGQGLTLQLLRAIWPKMEDLNF